MFFFSGELYQNHPDIQDATSRKDQEGIEGNNVLFKQLGVPEGEIYENSCSLSDCLVFNHLKSLKKIKVFFDVLRLN